MDISTIDNKVQQVISSVKNLPTPPIVFHQIEKVINDPNASAAQVAAVLSEDPAMSVKVLKLTNSAYYGLAREVESVKQAVVMVGLEAVKNLVLSASVMGMFKGSDIDSEFQDAYWRHSLATAFCCRVLARKIKSRGAVDPEAAFSAGLLHDVGKMILSCYVPEDYARVKSERAVDSEVTDEQIEERVLGYNHAQLGGVLAAQWKLPENTMKAIAFHHRPQLSDLERPLAHIVYLADYIAKDTFYDRTEAHRIGTVDEAILDHLQVSRESLAVFNDLLREEYVKAETFMQMAGLG